MLFKEVDSTAEKLEEMVDKRREKLKDIARIRALEKETEQVSLVIRYLILSWTDCLFLTCTLTSVLHCLTTYSNFFFLKHFCL